MKNSSTPNLKNPFIGEYLNEMKDLIREFKEEFNYDFKGMPKTPQTPVKSEVPSAIPAELWETSDKYILRIYLRGVRNKNNVKVKLRNNKTVNIKIDDNTLIPIENATLLWSDVSDALERDIEFPNPILTEDFTKDFKDGVLTICFKKTVTDIEIPIDF